MRLLATWVAFSPLFLMEALLMLFWWVLPEWIRGRVKVASLRALNYHTGKFFPNGKQAEGMEIVQIIQEAFGVTFRVDDDGWNFYTGVRHVGTMRTHGTVYLRLVIFGNQYFFDYRNKKWTDRTKI